MIRAILLCLRLDPDSPPRAPLREDEPALDLFSDDPFPNDSA